MINKIKDLIRVQIKRPIVRYFIMAAIIVSIEIWIFVFMNSNLKISYLIATPASNVVAIVLNWYFSRIVVFKNRSSHKKHIELSLVFLVSLVGIGIQLAVTAVAVQVFNTPPVLGKVGAIFITFFWNYWARNQFIFKSKKDKDFYVEVP